MKYIICQGSNAIHVKVSQLVLGSNLTLGSALKVEARTFAPYIHKVLSDVGRNTQRI